MQMENQNLSDDSTTMSPSSSPQHPPSNDVLLTNVTTEDSGAAEVEGETLKTPMQVLEELSAWDDEDDGSPVDGGTSRSGASVTVAIGGGSMVVEEQGRKRKASKVKDSPNGTPTSPVCKKQFLKPPVFASIDPPKGDGGENNKGEDKCGETMVASPVGGLEFDLNQQMEEAGSSDAAESETEEKVVDEGNILAFDLNELPATEDEE